VTGTWRRRIIWVGFSIALFGLLMHLISTISSLQRHQEMSHRTLMDTVQQLSTQLNEEFQRQQEERRVKEEQYKKQSNTIEMLVENMQLTVQQ
jgi:predicted Holliday junction resolvase-like endonuclease